MHYYVVEVAKKRDKPRLVIHLLHPYILSETWTIKREKEKKKKLVMKGSMGNCPVCHKVFHSKDIEHMLDLVGTHSSKLPVMFRRNLGIGGIVTSTTPSRI